jgi:adenylate cyclase
MFEADAKPIVLDTVMNFWGRLLPGAVGLKNSGLGGTLDDQTPDRLHRTLSVPTGTDMCRPVVAVGFNSERFDGHNPALRLVALGYNNVYWYRGGREAWEVAGQPETQADVREW